MADALEAHRARIELHQLARAVAEIAEPAAHGRRGREFIVAGAYRQDWRSNRTETAEQQRMFFPGIAVFQPRTALGPLQRDTGRQVFQPAKAATGKVADQPGHRRHEQVPLGVHAHALISGVVAPVGVLPGDVEVAIHLAGGLGKARHEAAGAVPHGHQQPVRITLTHEAHRGVEVVLAPVAPAHLHAAQALRPRPADAAKVVGQCGKTVLGKKVRVACVIARQHTGGATDDHRAALGTGRPPELCREGETVRAVQGNGFRHGKDLSNCCAATLPGAADFCHNLPAPCTGLAVCYYGRSPPVTARPPASHGHSR